jgi:hypothetical protein
MSVDDEEAGGASRRDNMASTTVTHPEWVTEVHFMQHQTSGLQLQDLWFGLMCGNFMQKYSWKTW